jgi:hypothetical protein
MKKQELHLLTLNPYIWASCFVHMDEFHSKGREKSLQIGLLDTDSANGRCYKSMRRQDSGR